MASASTIRVCDLTTTDSGPYTTPHTSRKTPPSGKVSAYVDQGLPAQVPHFNKPSPSPSLLTSNSSNSTDSGYVSISSSQGKETLARKLLKRTPKKLSIFEKDIPDPVKNRFHDLCVLFNEPLYRYLAKHGVTFTAISIKLKCAGESEATAKPWIIVQCDERASKRVRRFFNQQQLKAHYQPRDAQSPDVDFGLLVHATPPKQMATSENYICGDICCKTPTLCGVPIKACTPNKSRLATIGGLVKVVSSTESQLYGMTAGHIFPRKGFAQDVTDDDDNDESSEEGEYEEEYELDLGSAEGEQGASSIDLPALSPKGPQQGNLLQPQWPQLGHLAFVSQLPTSNNDLDWALVQFQDPTLYRPNSLVFPEHTYEAGFCAVLREGPRRMTRATRSRDVLLLSGMPGLKRGKLATSFGYLMIGPVKQFNEIYNVSMSDGFVLNAGDCGSWVVDSVTHEVYGHVVASDAFGDAYVIPLDNTFRDMKQQLAAYEVCLPTESEVFEWVKRRNTIAQPAYPLQYSDWSNFDRDTAVPNVPWNSGDVGQGLPQISESRDRYLFGIGQGIGSLAGSSDSGYWSMSRTLPSLTEGSNLTLSTASAKETSWPE